MRKARKRQRVGKAACLESGAKLISKFLIGGVELKEGKIAIGREQVNDAKRKSVTRSSVKAKRVVIILVTVALLLSITLRTGFKPDTRVLSAMEQKDSKVVEQFKKTYGIRCEVASGGETAALQMYFNIPESYTPEEKEKIEAEFIRAILGKNANLYEELGEKETAHTLAGYTVKKKQWLFQKVQVHPAVLVHTDNCGESCEYAKIALAIHFTSLLFFSREPAPVEFLSSKLRFVSPFLFPYYPFKRYIVNPNVISSATTKDFVPDMEHYSYFLVDYYPFDVYSLGVFKMSPSVFAWFYKKSGQTVRLLHFGRLRRVSSDKLP